MIEGLKPLYNGMLKPLVAPLVKIGVKPNHLTLAGLVCFSIAGWLVYKRSWHAALALGVIGSLLDGLDGVVARMSNQKSVFGAILDSSCDRLTEIFLIMGVLGYLLTSPIISFSRNALSLHERAWGVVLCYLAITVSLMVSYIKARSEGAGIPCNRGLLQRPERLLLLGAGLYFGPHSMIWILGVISILGAVTIIQRFFEAYQGAKK